MSKQLERERARAERVREARGLMLADVRSVRGGRRLSATIVLIDQQWRRLRIAMTCGEVLSDAERKIGIVIDGIYTRPDRISVVVNCAGASHFLDLSAGQILVLDEAQPRVDGVDWIVRGRAARQRPAVRQAKVSCVIRDALQSVQASCGWF